MQQTLNSLHQAGWTYIASKSIQLGYPLLDVNVITCSSAYHDLIYIAAVDHLIEYNDKLSIDSIMSTACTLADDINIFTTEHVDITLEGITAFINVDTIDAECIPLVCHMVQIALSSLEGKHGSVQFSNPMQFSIDSNLPPQHRI